MSAKGQKKSRMILNRKLNQVSTKRFEHKGDTRFPRVMQSSIRTHNARHECCKGSGRELYELAAPTRQHVLFFGGDHSKQQARSNHFLNFLDRLSDRKRLCSVLLGVAFLLNFSFHSAQELEHWLFTTPPGSPDRSAKCEYPTSTFLLSYHPHPHLAHAYAQHPSNESERVGYLRSKAHCRPRLSLLQLVPSAVLLLFQMFVRSERLP